MTDEGGSPGVKVYEIPVNPICGVVFSDEHGKWQWRVTSAWRAFGQGAADTLDLALEHVKGAIESKGGGGEAD